jgi:membrane protease YdiL (CAAX protease family)
VGAGGFVEPDATQGAMMSSIDAVTYPVLNAQIQADEPETRGGSRNIGVGATCWFSAFAIAGSFLSALIAVMAVALWNSAFATLAVEQSAGPIAMMASQLAVPLMLFWYLRAKGLNFQEYVGLTRPQGPYLQLGIAAVLIALGVPIALHFVTSSELIQDIDAQVAPLRFPLSAALTWIVGLVLAPFVEETFFRGFLLRGISQSRLGEIGAVMVTAILWALLHTDRTWIGVIGIVIFGLLLGFVRVRTRSTAVPMGIHLVYNFVGSMGLTFMAISTSSGSG